MNTLPNEIFISFMFPVMSVPDLLRLSQTNSHLNELITIFLHHCSGGRLIADEYYGLSDLYKLARTYSQYKNLVIAEITARLASTKKRDLISLLRNKYTIINYHKNEDDNIYKWIYNGNLWSYKLIKNLQEFEEAINAGEIKKPDDYSNSRLITLEFILQHPEINWSYDDMIFNPNLTVDFFLSSYDFYEPSIINLIQGIAYNPAISMSDYEKIWHKYEMACVDMNENFDSSLKEEWYFFNPNQTTQNIRKYLSSGENKKILEAIAHNAFNKTLDYIYLAQKIRFDLMF